MKKLVTFAAAASLMLGSMGVTAYGASFADIDTVTWSGFKPFLNQAAELGLMNGYDENGKRYCKPRNNVTYCEAVQLMYSIMKVYTKQDVNDATVTKWKPVISAYNIPEWAYKATAYGLENSILTTSELNKLQGGTKAANREDVGVFFGKALDTVDGYDVKSGASLGYNDKSQVSAAAVPYLELLNRAELMVGDSDNKFNPKNNITRAEMAVLSVKSYNKLTENETTKPAETTTTNTAVGTVTSSMVMQNGDLFLTMSTNTGSTLSLFCNKGDVTPKYDGEKIGFDDIGTGDTVKVTYKGQYMSAIEVTYSKRGIDRTTEETYELVDLTDSRITVESGSKEKEYRLLSGVEVKLDDKKSSVSKLQDAMEDMKYTVTLTLNEDERVTKIVAVKSADNPTKGTLIDLSNSEITIKAGSKEYEYPLTDDDITVEKDDKEMRFSKLKSDYEDYNYTVSLKLNKKGEVTEIIIEDYEDETKGTLTKITIRKIEIESAGEPYEYYLNEDVDVEIDGKSSTLDKLKKAFNDEEKAFTVELDLDRDDYVTEIIAETKSAEGSEGEIVKVTSSEITVKDGKKEITNKFASDVKIKINGKSREISDLKDSYEDYTYEVKLEFDSKGKVSKVDAEIKEIEEGTLKDINEDKEQITVTAGSIDVTLDLASSVKITLDGSSISLKKLNNELDYAYDSDFIVVELSYNSSGDVTKIEAEWTEEKPEKADLISVNRSDDEIRIETNKGKKYTCTVDEDVKITYSFSANVNERKYDKPDDYASSLRGLENFLDDCEDNNDECALELQYDKHGNVTRIWARAE